MQIQFGNRLTREEVASFLADVGSRIPLGKVSVSRECGDISDESLAEIGALACLIDNALPFESHMTPSPSNKDVWPHWERIVEILDSEFAKQPGKAFGARFGGFHLWDIRIERNAHGQFSWDRCRQGMLQSDSSFWTL